MGKEPLQKKMLETSVFCKMEKINSIIAQKTLKKISENR